MALLCMAKAASSGSADVRWLLRQIGGLQLSTAAQRSRCPLTCWSEAAKSTSSNVGRSAGGCFMRLLALSFCIVAVQTPKLRRSEVGGWCDMRWLGRHRSSRLGLPATRRMVRCGSWRLPRRRAWPRGLTSCRSSTVVALPEAQGRNATTDGRGAVLIQVRLPLTPLSSSPSARRSINRESRRTQAYAQAAERSTCTCGRNRER